MGWGYGIDANGREVGYRVTATCDWPGCDSEIDRGLSHACGGMHDENEVGCAGYYCTKHLMGSRRRPGGDGGVSVCNDCAKPPSKRRRPALEFTEPGKLINSIIADICQRPRNKGEPEVLRCTGNELRAILRRRLAPIPDLKLALRILSGPGETGAHMTAVDSRTPITIKGQLGDVRRGHAALAALEAQEGE